MKIELCVSYSIVLCLLGGVVGLAILPVNEKENNICCMPQEWEAQMYLDYGTVFIDSNTAFAYFNGSVHAAYSTSKNKVYFHIKGFELSPLIPKPEPMNTTLLYDFENNKMYTVQFGSCQKTSLDANLTLPCIPRHAKHVSDGIVGYGNTTRLFHTYQFITDIDVAFTITASVFINDTKLFEPKICQPQMVHYFAGSANPDSGSLYSLEFLDMGPLVSKDIFDVPKPCL
ncbi:hypothetical protein ACF0H5_000997 [Mactra antiquata]